MTLASFVQVQITFTYWIFKSFGDNIHTKQGKISPRNANIS